jgi:hypothetical protein
MMLWFLLWFGTPFDLRPFIETVWNMEVIDHSRDLVSFYHFNLTKSFALNAFEAELFPGDAPGAGKYLPSDQFPSLAKFEIEMQGEQSGILSLVEPSTIHLTDFNFVDTFTEFLGAYGTYNQTMTYAANLVNLATLHVNLFSFDENLFQEVILTRISTEGKEPWYERHGKILAGVGMFVLTFLILRFGQPCLHMLGIL